MSKYIIDAVIPAYNAEKTIEKSVRSVAEQHYPVQNIIVIDDGSTDNTVSIIKKLQGEFPNLILLQQENSGPSKARNYGILSSNAEWIGFLDADDYWPSDRLSIQIDHLESYPSTKLIGGCMDEIEFNTKIQQIKVSLIKCCFKNFFKTSTVLVRKQAVEAFYFDESKSHSEDYKLWLQLCSRHQAYYLNTILARQVIRKRAFGESGLSADIVAIEKGELSNFKYLRQQKLISFPFYLFISLFSILKFLRRLIITKFIA